MTRYRFQFTGSGLEFSAVSILLSIAAVLTLGLLLPYVFYWQVKYIVEHVAVLIATASETPPPP